MNKISSPESFAVSNQGPLFPQTTSVPEAVARTLEEGGVELCLGICAGFTTPFFAALYEKTSIRTIQVRQEILGAIGANAYSRLTSKPAVISGEGEFILGTATQGIIESLLGGTPMIIVTEMFDGGRMSHHGNYHSGSGDLGSYDAVSAFKAICKKVFVSYHPAQAVQHTQLALKHAMSGDPGPVAIILHSSSLEGTVGPDSFPRLYPTARYVRPNVRSVDAESVASAVEALSRSTRPMIIAGHGVRLSQAYNELSAFSDAIGAPVVTTQGGKGVFDETSALGGGVFGEWGRDSANALVADADLIIAVGTKLGPLDTVDQTPRLIDPTRQRLIQIDIEPMNSAWTLPIDHVVTGDAKAALAALTEAVAASGRKVSDGARHIADAIQKHDMPEPATATSEEFPLRPERLARLIQEEWPEDGIIVSDAGESRVHMLRWFNSTGGGRYILPHGGGGMGYAIPGAFGAKIAEPDRACLGILGDGGFSMTMNTLMNAVQEKVPFAVLIFNNKALGWPLHVMGDDTKKHFEFHDFDHAEIAKSMGANGKRCKSVEDVRQALREARDSKVPYVIDVPITIDATFVHSTSKLAFEPRQKPWLVKAE